MELDIHVVLPSGREVLAGAISDTGGIIAFEYARGYIAEDGAYPLAPALPLGRGEFLPAGGRAMPPGIADAQPDAWGRRLMQSIDRQRTGRYRALTELDILGRVSDRERLGALRVVEGGAYQMPQAADAPGLTELPRLIEAAKAAELGEDVPDDLLGLLEAGTSMGGARPKATVVNSRGRLAIAKLPAREDFGDAMAWEATALDLARRAKVRVAHFDHYRFESRSTLIVERFDRDEERRIGYLSADGLLNKAPGGDIDYVRLATALQRHSADADADSAELFRRVAVSLLVNNVDDHMRNHGFLRQERGWSLSPAFDITPFYKAGAVDSTPISVDDDPRDRDIRNLLASHDAFRLRRGDAVAAIREVEAATADWAEVARAFGIAPEAVPPLHAAFENENRIRARSMTAPVVTDVVDLGAAGRQTRAADGRFGPLRG
jgi:serine/threonine-protein kinase HipA